MTPEIEELAAHIGVDGSWADEHERYALYQSALGAPSARGELLRAIATEPDIDVASTIVASLLEAVTPEERAHLVALVPPKGQEFLTSRSADLSILDAIEAGGSERDPALVARVIAASDWLQRRVVGQASPAPVLEALATAGRTRRVRSAAQQRLRAKG